MSSEAKPKSAKFGDYTLTGHLGEGGMCHVFRARKKGDLQDCALKMLKEEFRSDERILDLFVTEADLALLLQHPNLVATYDAGEIQGRHYIAMELIEGGNLREIIAECQRSGVRLPADFALFIVSEVLEGLEAVHSARSHAGGRLGLIHRDVTPQNVFVSFDGRVILGDLGIAHIRAYGEADTGIAVGKLGYLSPEQAAGEPIDSRSDLFSLSVILFELLTSSRLYDEGTDREILAAIAEARAPRLRRLKPGLSKSLETTVQRCLMKRPRDRFQTAEEMVLALEPHWSPMIGNPKALGALMCGLFREKSREFSERRARARSTWSIPPPSG
jgi:eukaryotic-like serine/threonine-protein kinase